MQSFQDFIQSVSQCVFKSVTLFQSSLVVAWIYLFHKGRGDVALKHLEVKFASEFSPKQALKGGLWWFR